MARVSDGPTEALNNLIKRIKRIGFGFRNFENYRIRALLYAGQPELACARLNRRPLNGRDPDQIRRTVISGPPGSRSRHLGIKSPLLFRMS